MLIFSLNHAWNKLHGEPTNEDSYQVGGMRLRLPELQAQDQEGRKVGAGSRSPYQVSGMRLRLQKLQAEDQWSREVQSKQGLKDGWEEDVNGMFLWEGLPIPPPSQVFVNYKPCQRQVERRFPPTHFPQESLLIWLHARWSLRTRGEATTQLNNPLNHNFNHNLNPKLKLLTYQYYDSVFQKFYASWSQGLGLSSN